jgi:hypothetical protein
MSSPSTIVKTRLKGPIHARFLAEQAERGISESELLRQALNHFFERPKESPPHAETKPDATIRLAAPSPEQSSLERKTVWMPAYLMRGASARAQEKGMSFSRWACSLVQSNLMHNPVLTDPELLMVEAATRELAAIGRNINQIARALDDAYFQTERIRLDKLNELSSKISALRESVGGLVRASRHSWRAD